MAATQLPNNAASRRCESDKANPGIVIPGGPEEPDLRCAIAHRGISRFRVRYGACHRAARRADPLASPRNDDLKLDIFGLLPGEYRLLQLGHAGIAAPEH